MDAPVAIAAPAPAPVVDPAPAPADIPLAGGPPAPPVAAAAPPAAPVSDAPLAAFAPTRGPLSPEGAPPAPAPDAAPTDTPAPAPPNAQTPATATPLRADGGPPDDASGKAVPAPPTIAAPAVEPRNAQATVAPEVPSAPVAPRPAPAATTTAGDTLKPVEMVRRLQHLQDRIAAGSVEGVATQRAVIANMDQAFASADPSVWQDPANARALISYFLSGGSPPVLRAIITRDPRPAIDEKLLLGTLLYTEGREDAALRELGEVDARKLPNLLGAQIALAQATLTVRQDPQKASELLDLARLLAPGTLVEEAALRREILVAAQRGDVAAFERLSRHYLYRFNRSAYADNFRQRFASAMVRMQVADSPDGLARLKDLLTVLDDEGRREMYLLVARAALMEGKTTLAAGAALRARELAATASRDAERAQVYLGAAEAVMPNRFQAAAEALKRVDRSRLEPADSALVDAALSTANSVRQADQLPLPDKRAPSPPSTADDIKPSPAMSRARDALTKIDALLKAAPR